MCPAFYGLNIYGAHSNMLAVPDAAAHAQRVNVANETGTLYPQYPLTLLPLTVFEGRDDSGNREIMGKHIMDAFEANERYWKIPHLVFALDGNGFDEELAEEVLCDRLRTTDFVHTRAVSLTH